MKKIPDSLWRRVCAPDPDLTPSENLELAQTVASQKDIGEAVKAGRITSTEARTLLYAIQDRDERYLSAQQT